VSSNFSVEAPINTLSFGNVAFGILNELRVRGFAPPIKSVGDKADLSNLRENHPIFDWVERGMASFEERHQRSSPILKIWHISNSLQSYSNKQYLFTFYELDSPTPTEVNILKNQERVLVSSKYTKEVFESAGVENVVYCPLGFDSENYHKVSVRRPTAKVIFGLVGKLEKRKAHHKVLKAWSKRYGNNKNYMLNCAIQNPFISGEEQSRAILGMLGGERFFNINFLGFMPSNSLYNEFLNSNDIILGMSHAEGFGLPEFHSLGLGKHGVILNAHAYKDWANSKNAVLVNPTGKIDAADGVFFRNGGDYNQGQYYDWNEDEFIAACEASEKRFLDSPLNEEGLKLQQEFTYSKTCDIIVPLVTAG